MPGRRCGSFLIDDSTRREPEPRRPGRRASILALLPIAALVLLSIGGSAAAAPSSPSRAMVVRTYDIRVVGSGTVTFKDPAYQETAHWLQTVPGMRLRVNTYKGRGKKRAWRFVGIFGSSKRGTYTVSADYTANDEGCPAHATFQGRLTESASASLGSASIVIGAQNSPSNCQGAEVHGYGGTRDGVKQGGNCTGRAGLCWEIHPYWMALSFPNLSKKGLRGLRHPIDQIRKGLRAVMKIKYSNTDYFGTEIKLSVQVVLIPRKG